MHLQVGYKNISAQRTPHRQSTHQNDEKYPWGHIASFHTEADQVS
jgi:hypothetical protein